MNQTEASTWPKGLCEFLLAINIFLSITASLGNALILAALHKETSLHPPTKLLYRCLAVTDLCVGLITQPAFTVALMSFSTIAINWKVSYYADKAFNAASIILCQISIFTSTAISVDRLLALLMGLRYRHVVTLRRVRAVLTCFWLIGVSCGSIFFWNRKISFTLCTNFVSLSLATSMFSFTKIYLKLRHRQHQVHVPGQPNGRGIPQNISQYKKSVFSALWVQLTLFACYTPFVVVFTPMTYGLVSGIEIEVAFFFTSTIAYLNSSLNPILYCWKIKPVRQAAKDTMKQLNCGKSA